MALAPKKMRLTPVSAALTASLRMLSDHSSSCPVEIRTLWSVSGAARWRG